MAAKENGAKALERRQVDKHLSGVTVGHRPGPVSEVTKLVARQNEGATATGYPDTTKPQPTKDKGRTNTAPGSDSPSF